MATAVTLCERVSLLHLFTHTRCAQCSPSIHLFLASHVFAPARGRIKSKDRAIYAYYIISEETVIFSFL